MQAEQAARAAAERANKPSVLEMMRDSKGVSAWVAEAKSAKETQAEERRAFLAEIASRYAERNAPALEKRRAAGQVYEPTGEGGGDAVAALFSSSAV